LRGLLADSQIRESHRGGQHHKVQDPYSIRCMPQVHGAARDAMAWIRGVIQIEMNSATDNPLVFQDGAILSGGNFHGEPVAIALDLLAIATAELGAISERRVEHLLNPSLSEGLPPFLAFHSGLCSGLMIAQVTAAALVSENKILAHPASVDSIPSSANREDHVSMGMTAALKARQIVDNVRLVLAIEALCAAAGIDLRAPRLPGLGVRAAHAVVREDVPPVTGDRPISPDVEALDRRLRRGGGLVEAAVAASGPA
jgi:histidine ammonia-lyase